ncbi:PREDICTED: protein CROC-4 isoform X3 [Hipposideros armiger]|uniref:Protein CROC-4 isoform X3 n=1 Tax=Hipposideros armiger TaxID=186990 RepID=A0A8B7SXS3_HIPAR|nr:PREDICTED: protein CROC-4 isoform X3 [Hipposideros armiger]
MSARPGFSPSASSPCSLELWWELDGLGPENELNTPEAAALFVSGIIVGGHPRLWALTWGGWAGGCFTTLPPSFLHTCVGAASSTTDSARRSQKSGRGGTSVTQLVSGKRQPLPIEAPEFQPGCLLCLVPPLRISLPELVEQAGSGKFHSLASFCLGKSCPMSDQGLHC